MKKNLFSLFNLSNLVMVGGAMLVATLSFAKLPAPSDEAKAKADEAKAKTAWSDKLAAYQLCKAQDKVAAKYAKVKSPATSTMLAAGASSAVSSPNPSGATAVTMPACTDPGPYVSVVVAVLSPSSPASVVAPAAAAPGTAVNAAVKSASDVTAKSK